MNLAEKVYAPHVEQREHESTHADPEVRLLAEIFGKPPTEFQMAVTIERGLPLRSVDVLRNEGLTFTEVHGLVLPARTLKHRKEKKQLLSPEEADRALRVVRVIALAERIFGQRDKAFRWLRRPNKRLEERAPLAMLRSEAGGDLVRQMLHQIDEGIYI